jgi:hypothetical protein
MATPNYPRYVSPKERAENRARIRRFILWSAAGIAAAVILMLFAFTDQAPAWLRELAFNVDGAFGYPILWLIKMIAT